jgi:hypothetical protein
LDETNLEARKTGNNLVGFPDWSYSAIAATLSRHRFKISLALATF